MTCEVAAKTDHAAWPLEDGGSLHDARATTPPWGSRVAPPKRLPIRANMPLALEMGLTDRTAFDEKEVCIFKESSLLPLVAST